MAGLGLAGFEAGFGLAGFEAGFGLLGFEAGFGLPGFEAGLGLAGFVESFSLPFCSLEIPGICLADMLGSVEPLDAFSATFVPPFVDPSTSLVLGLDVASMGAGFVSEVAGVVDTDEGAPEVEATLAFGEDETGILAPLSDFCSLDRLGEEHEADLLPEPVALAEGLGLL